MGCCLSSGEYVEPTPMRGNDRVGAGGVTRDDARERAAAAAEARANAKPRGQQGSAPRVKPAAPAAQHDGRVDVSNPGAWD